MYHSLALRLPQGSHDQVQMQVCLFQCRAICKCADECINNEGGGLTVTLITGTKEHTPRLISRYIVFLNNSYRHKDAICQQLPSRKYYI